MLSNLISVSLSRNDNTSAKDYAEKLIRVQPQSASALQGLAAIALAAGKYDQAAQRCAELTKIAPDNFEAHFVAVAQRKLNKLDEAIKTYRDALRIHPGSRRLLSISASSCNRRVTWPRHENRTRRPCR